MKKLYLFIFILLILPLSFAKSGSLKLLAVTDPDGANPRGSFADLYLEIKPGSGRVFMDSFPLSKIDTQISTRFAKEVACNFLEKDCSKYDFFYTIRSSSAIVGGPSAGAAVTVLTISLLDDLPLDKSVVITGTINTGGIIGPVGSVIPKSEKAAEEGIRKILIPKYSDVNETNITKIEASYDVDIIEVSQLTEAIYHFTGKNFSRKGDVEIDMAYKGKMKEISEELCQRAQILSKEAYPTYENNTAFTLMNSGLSKLDEGNYYSAASFCFASSFQFGQKKIKDLSVTEQQLRALIYEGMRRNEEFKNFTQKKSINTITDLETYMAVMDRVEESNDRFIEAIKSLNASINSSIYHYSYATERLNSAKSWSRFFGEKGKKFNFDKEELAVSCLAKISEVEERIQYIELYLPSGTKDAKESVERAYKDHNNGDEEMCLYEASLAKARINLILNSISIDPDHIEEVIEDRAHAVRQMLARQKERGIFPIVAYSYYEYADSLKSTDEYSALLYLEYSLELGNLDIYFEKEKTKMPSIELPYIILFICGFVLGCCITLLIVKRPQKRKK
ncbi:MAG: hypothetical protein NDI94_02535 [Candidatus Woesearchaeota archaeon]|nr:hypothetical protein [Candidatus Woesearchaeota archaeon]